MIQDRTTVTVELQLELVRDLLNGAISGAVTLSDNWPRLSKARHYAMLNISETVTDRAFVTMEY